MVIRLHRVNLLAGHDGEEEGHACRGAHTVLIIGMEQKDIRWVWFQPPKKAIANRVLALAFLKRGERLR